MNKKVSVLIVFLFIIPLYSIYSQNLQFNDRFAPHEGLVKQVQKPFRDEICLNGTWQFMPVKLPEKLSFEEIRTPELPSLNGWEEIPVKVPSPWNVNGFTNGKGGDFRSFPSYPVAWDKVKSGWLKKNMDVPADWSGNRIILHFEAVAGYTKIFVNGTEVGDHFDSFLPFRLDVTDHVTPGEKMEILVWVAHGSLLDDPGRFGRRNYVAGSFWGIHIAGIWQDVYLQKIPGISITDTYIKPMVDSDRLEIEVTIQNTTDNEVKFDLHGDVQRWVNLNGKSALHIPEVNWTLGERALSVKARKMKIGPQETAVYTLHTQVEGSLDTWSPAHPNLYGLVLTLGGKKGALDRDYTRFGWRQFDIQGDQLLLNGEPIVIRGDSWHFMGVPQMTRRYAWSWYQMLLDANANGVRLHAQVFPRFYLEMADEMGICVLDETAIWSSDGGPKIDSDQYWEACRNHVEGMVLRDRNYPSVFGWSVCNETLPVTKHVFNAPDEMVSRNIEEINKWVAIARENDPTRSWISGDGETQAETDLPTVIGHYGGDAELKRWSDQGKPWGIGETGMAYYGTPAQVAKINGDRAYESQLGRMEGLAGEAFELISRQRDHHASYTSIFNLAWYGLKPLPLGLEDTQRTPQSDDGVFFTGYTEGIPGYQPERLGPYSTTLNPGYDPTLPLYKPWPLFNAVKEAFSDNYKDLDNRWNQVMDNTVRTDQSYDQRSVVWLANESSDLKEKFDHLEIDFVPLDDARNQLILVDGGHPPAENPVLIESLRSAIEKGSSLLVWGAADVSIDFIDAVTNSKIEFYERNASSYIVSSQHPILNGQSNASLYFTEITKNPISTKTIGGRWTGNANVILEACNTDWRKWNYQPENVKTAMVYRAEQEAKPTGNVIVSQKMCSGEIIVSTVDFFDVGDQTRFLVRSMISHLGGTFRGTGRDVPYAIDKEGVLRNANFYGSVKNDSREIELVFDYDPLSAEEFMQVEIGTLTKGIYWDILSSGDDGVFNFLQENLKHKNHASVYLGFWMYSPRSLTDLLIEPDMPRLDMHMGVDDAVAVNINGELIIDYLRESAFIEDELTYEGVPLEKGWNHILIKVGQGTGDWKCRVRFTSTVPGFLDEIKTAVR